MIGFLGTGQQHLVGLTGDAHKNAVKFLIALAKAFIEEDASLAEINPLVVTKGGDVLALDAKFSLDDAAAFRHPVWKELQDKSEEEFSIFMKAMDDNHAVMLVREHLRNHAPPGRSVVKGIEKKKG